MSPTPTPPPRRVPAVLQLVHALVLGYAALVLPWRDWTLFAALTGLTALGHVLALVGAVVASDAAYARAWRLQAALSLLWLGWIGWAITSSATSIAVLYGGLGAGVAAALGGVFALVCLFGLPLSLWGLLATGGVRPTRLAAGAGLVAGLAIVGLIFAGAKVERRPTPTLGESAGAAADAIRAVLPLAPKREQPPSLMTRAPASCEHAPGPDRATLIATLVAPGADAPTTHCLQAATGDEVLEALRTLVGSGWGGGPIKIDLVDGVTPLVPIADLVDGLLIRPGQDGVCAEGRCLMAWQLVALDQFTTHMPLPFIQDLRFGVSGEGLRELLGAPEGGLAGLTRVTTRSLLVDASGTVQVLRRGRTLGRRLDALTVENAMRGMEDYVISAQRKNGRFRTTLDPYSGRVSNRGESLRRQAGATLAICEQGNPQREAVRQVARRSASYLAKQARSVGTDGTRAVLARSAKAQQPEIASTALSLAALVACRHHLGADHDPLIEQLGRTLLSAQREDGGFHMRVDRSTGAPVTGNDMLYANGQLVLALVSLEGVVTREPEAFGLDAATVHAATERAMDWFGGPFWDHPARDFFFIEENWHCLAAAAALPHHRHDGYERFCLDYLGFLQRLILGPEDGVPEVFVGGMGWGAQLPPHNTPSGGFGETLAAGLHVARARGLDTTEWSALMERVLTFLIQQQWTEADCFACSRKRRVAGGFSESMASPLVRIDYIQHAMSALGHGVEAAQLRL